MTQNRVRNNAQMTR